MVNKFLAITKVPMYSVLVSSRTFGYGATTEQLNQLFQHFSLAPTFLPLEKAVDRLDEFEGMIIGTVKLTRPMLTRAKRLRAIVKYGVGMDNIDLEAAKELGIQVANLPGVNAQAVAELALGLLFSLARKIAWGDRSIRSVKWEGLIGSNVSGKTLGIVGTGSIGCTLARMVPGLEMTILGYDISPSPEFTAAGGQYVELNELLSRSDFVSLHLTLTSQTAHFMNQDRLNRMKPGAFLINTSRGGVVDQAALTETLLNGHLGGAGLDVFETEPPSLGELAKLDQTVFTPHIGAYTDETLRKMDEVCVATLSKALQGH
jgi:D-3-phosphoglycerate dehydrogenase